MTHTASNATQLYTMRVWTAVYALLLARATAFVPPLQSHAGLRQSETSGTTPVALEAHDNDETRHQLDTSDSCNVSPIIPLPVVTALAASIFMFSPLVAQPIAYAAEKTVDVAAKVELSAEQKAIATAKSALDEATTKYAQVSKSQKEAEAVDKKAESAVSTAEQNVEKLRKRFINSNDKLAAAKAKGDEKAVAAETKAVADTKAAIASAEKDLSAARLVKIDTGKKLALIKGESTAVQSTINKQKATIAKEEGKIAKQKAEAVKIAKKQKEAEAKKQKRAKQEQKRLNDLAAKKAKKEKKLEKERAKKEAQQKKKILETKKRLEKQAKEREEKVKAAEKKAADRLKEQKQKEIAAKSERISQMKKAKGKMKDKAAQRTMDARIQAETEQLKKMQGK